MLELQVLDTSAAQSWWIPSGCLAPEGLRPPWAPSRAAPEQHGATRLHDLARHYDGTRNRHCRSVQHLQQILVYHVIPYSCHCILVEQVADSQAHWLLMLCDAASL